MESIGTALLAKIIRGRPGRAGHKFAPVAGFPGKGLVGTSSRDDLVCGLRLRDAPARPSACSTCSVEERSRGPRSCSAEVDVGNPGTARCCANGRYPGFGFGYFPLCLWPVEAGNYV